MKILVVNTSRIGDLVSGMGVVRFLRERYGALDVLPNPRYRGALEGEPGVDAVSPGEARRRRYDLLVDLSSSKMSMGYVGDIESENKICLYSSLPKLLCAFPVYNIRLKREDSHIVRAYSPIFRFFGQTGDPVPVLTDNRNPGALRFLQEIGGTRLAGIHFDAATERRFLPESLVEGIIRSLRERKIGALLLGTRGEIARRLVDRSGGYARWREFTLAELKTVIAGLDIFIGSDSGPLHIAAALGVPSIGVYGPNVSRVSGPLAPCVRFVEIPMDCRPCNQNRKCPHDVRCLTNIPLDQVMGEADRILGKGASGGVLRKLRSRVI